MNASLDEVSTIAILRGVAPDRVLEIGRCLLDAGIDAIEVPLNTDKALECISILSDAFREEAIIGAGTVVTVEQVEAVAKSGGRLIVSPNTDKDVIHRTRDLGLISVPGCLTPTEAYLALQSGADALKIFPANILGPAGIKAICTILPMGTKVYAVGGVDAGNLRVYLEAGASGAGFGSSLFSPCMATSEIQEEAARICAVLHRGK